MKRYLVVVLVLIFSILPLSAQIPQWGNWYFEIIGTELTVDVQITGNTWVFDLGGGVTSTQTVTIDAARSSIKIPMFAGISDDFVYDAKSGFIDFYHGQAFHLNLYQLMTDPIIDLSYFYGVSRDWTSTVMEDLRRSFLRAPLLRLRPDR